ncbi:FAD-dependent oxidoreductase [Microcoleus sp. FACHB-1515]|uniref:FAD-dependent oxidoreductase n=1 Tax=Cyanophyceae TaxID=3028117 RepID=UPI001682B9FB|nr:FAD-dependent oxidoreductase [Microcoleus sp. FACHB-1515]MBD2089567.1 FAD-dependent oxidoreductase [Microcoleus sp. FACHB-1515]
MKSYQVVILGSGISGVAFARLMQRAGLHDFVLLEAAGEAGGLCRTRHIDGHWLDIGGGHFLCTKYPEVYDFVFAHLPKSEFNFFTRVSKLAIENHEIDYPIESNLWQLPIALQTEFLNSVLQNGESRGLPAPQHFEDWVRWKLGDRIADSYMIPYNTKIWGVSPQELDIDWLSKIPRLNLEEIMFACKHQQAPSGKMPSHEGFYYPKQGGFQTVFDAIARPVQNHIQLNTPAINVAIFSERIIVNDEFEAAIVINTVPWSKLNFEFASPEIERSIAQLQHNSITVSLHEQPKHLTAHWIYEPDLNLRHHRRFFIHNFAPHSRKDGVYFETNQKRWSTSTDVVYFHHNEYAYPIPTLGRAQAIDRVLSYMRDRQIFGLGRWGQWQYFNSDVCIWEAMKLFRSLFQAVPIRPVGVR